MNSVIISARVVDGRVTYPLVMSLLSHKSVTLNLIRFRALDGQKRASVETLWGHL